MTTQIRYRQCLLQRKLPTGVVETTTYLPAKFAKVGRVVCLKEKDGTWSEDWTVTLAGQLTDNPPDWRALIKGHRKMTGDSIPKATRESA